MRIEFVSTAIASLSVGCPLQCLGAFHAAGLLPDEMLFAAYMWWLTASPLLPGPPIWQIQAADLKDVINESINFWYVNIGLEAAGLPYVPAEAVSPLQNCLHGQHAFHSLAAVRSAVDQAPY